MLCRHSSETLSRLSTGNDKLQRIQVECLMATVVTFVVTAELICVARQNDRRC